MPRRQAGNPADLYISFLFDFRRKTTAILVMKNLFDAQSEEPSGPEGRKNDQGYGLETRHCARSKTGICWDASRNHQPRPATYRDLQRAEIGERTIEWHSTSTRSI
jgi:hypothetical protein